MPNPLHGLGCDSRKNLNGQDRGGKVGWVTVRFAQPTAAALSLLCLLDWS